MSRAIEKAKQKCHGLIALYFTLAILIFGSALPYSAYGATYYVGTTADQNDGGDCTNAANSDCSLRDAVAAATASAGEDTVQVPAGSYVLSLGQITSNNGKLNVVGAGAGVTTIDGNNASRIFDTGWTTAGMSFTDITLTGGNAGAAADGGCVWMKNESITVTNSVFSYCSARRGGAIFSDQIITVTVTGSTFNNNVAANGASNGGGAIQARGITVGNSTFSYNSAANADGRGGAIYSLSTLSITGSTFNNNQLTTGGPGGAVYALQTVTIDTSTFDSNATALGEGGAVYIGNGGTSATITDSYFVGNSSTGDGGAIRNIEPDALTIDGCTFESNSSSSADGGALVNYDGTTTISNSTFSGNSAAVEGGAIRAGSYTLTLNYVTFYNNAAGGVNRGGAVAGNAVTTLGTIYSGNTSNSVANACGWSVVTSSGYNVDHNSECGFTPTTGDVTGDPLLQALADNGGPTKTHAIISGPAVDGGPATCTAETGDVDQRNTIRPQGTSCDIGAYESNDTTPPEAVSDLAVTDKTTSSIKLIWTAPGNDGSSGTATTYDVRYSTSIITDANWASATQATGEPAPGVAGSSEAFIVTGLSASQTYYFAIKTSDSAVNTSGLSNIASATTYASGTFIVTTTADEVDGTCDITHCSLREAVDAANANSGTDTIVMGTGTHVISLGSAGEDANAGGDFDITETVIIEGAGSAFTTVDGVNIDRIFQFTGVTLTLKNMKIIRGTVNGDGGCLHTTGALVLEDVIMSDSTINKCSATGTNFGGAIYSEDNIDIINSEFHYNDASSRGGAIHTSGVLTIYGSTFTNNIGSAAASYGGAIASSGSTISITSSTFTSNIAGTAAGDGRGGAIWAQGAVTVTTSSFGSNWAGQNGGALFIDTGGSLDATRTIFNSNTSDHGGGGACYVLGNSILGNVTLTGNSSPNDGGAIHSRQCVITNATFYENSSSGVKYVNKGVGGGSCTITNSIFYDSTPTDTYCSGTTTGGNNISNETTDSCGFTGASLDILGTDPLLNPLADNGGPTLTHSLQPTSQAIDSADNTDCAAAPVNSVDQRGESRGFDGNAVPDNPQTGDCDMGAYEKTTTLQTTIVGDGVSPADKSAFGSDTNKAVDAFTLSATSGTDTLTALTLTFSGTDVSDVAASGVKIYKDVNNDSEWDAGDTLITNGTASFSGTTATFTGLSESIGTTSTQYIVTYDLVASPTDGNKLQGSVTAVTTGNTPTIVDTVDAFLIAGGVCIPDTFSDDPAAGFTLRECIDWANNNPGADVINLSAGTYKITRSGVDGTNVNGDFDILDDLTINGAGIATTTIEGIGVDGDHIMEIDSAVANFTVSNLRFYNGSYTAVSGGCLYSASATQAITITNVEFDTCKSSRGGALSSLSDAVTISGSVFKNNVAEASTGFISGGALYLIHCAQIDNTTFIDNSVVSTGAATGLRGGALYMSCSFGDGAFTLSNLIFKGNSLSGSGEGFGGAAYLAGGGDATDLLTVADSTFGGGFVSDGNTSTTHGGAIYHAGGPVVVSSSTFQNNVAADSGGAIYTTGSKLTINNASATASSFTENTANGTNVVTAGSEESGGGAIYAQGVIVTIDDTTISNNNSAHWGGGVALTAVTLDAQTLTVTNSTISGNQADDSGGGLLSHGHVIIDSTTVSGNSTTAAGGGSGAGLAAINAAKNTDITKTIFSTNAADGNGGAIYGLSSVRLANTTLSSNSATGDGGGLYIQGCQLRNVTIYGSSATTNDSIYSVVACSDIYNTIIDNGASGNNNCNATVTPTNSNNNIENKDTCGLADATDQTTTDPQLNALADNGGSTWTHSFPDGTPAVNNGDNTVCSQSTIYASVDGVDQRGVARPIGGTCDIGAFESAYIAGIINIFGSCKQVDEITDCTDTGTIRFAVNGSLQAETQATVSGSWTISGVTAPSSGDVITVYIEGAADANEAVAVTKYDGFGNISGIQLMEEHLTIGNNDTQTITNTDLGQYDNSVSGSEDIFHDVNAGLLTADITGSLTNEEIFIVAGNTLSPGGTVTTNHMHLAGMLNATGTANINVSGNWINNGSFTPGTSTVVFNGADQTISGSTVFNNLSKADSVNDSTDLTLTFDNTATQTINGTLTLDGLDGDDRINLVSDSPGTQWSINLTATATKAIDFVDVSDSDASASNAALIPVNPTDSVDSGNNIDWFSLPLVKAVYRGDTCVASSDGDAACNGGATSSPVLTGEKITFVIYISNAGASVYSDARFQDNIDDAGPDYFEFQGDSYGAGQGIKWATTGSGSSTKAEIKTAANGGTALTNAFDGSTGTNEYCGIDISLSPDVLKCGGDTVTPDNDQINIGANDTFVIMFDAIKRD